MFEAMTAARNAAVRTAMAQTCGQVSEDPGAIAVLPTRWKREMVDEIANVLQATVRLIDGNECSFYCIATIRDSSVLKVELTNENMELLTKQPAVKTVGADPVFEPAINDEHVYWRRAGSSLYCKYVCADSKKLRMKTFRVNPSPDPEVYQARVDAMIPAVKVFYGSQHTAEIPGDSEPSE